MDAKSATNMIKGLSKYALFIICLNIYLLRKLYQVYFIYTNSNTNRIVFFSPKVTRNIKIEAFLLIIAIVVLAFLSIIFFGIVLYLSSLFAALLILFIEKPTTFENKNIISKNLTLGYGAALWYYKNYLGRFLEENLKMRIRQFISLQRVDLPEKLFILCPRTCKVQKYIDETSFIERCRELPPLKTDTSGIKGRVYNITVYKLHHSFQSFRCAIEYAQPLETLLKFKEKGRISACELSLQREEFCRHLRQFLVDGNNSHRLCELVEYDDDTEDIQDALFKTKSIQEFLNSTNRNVM